MSEEYRNGLSENEEIDGYLDDNSSVAGAIASGLEVFGGIIDQNVIDRTAIHYNTVANWNTRRLLIAEKAHFYIYTNAKTTYNDKGRRIYIPGLKIGDGTSYLIDMPFVMFGNTHDVLEKHINDRAIHLNAVDRQRLDNSISVDVSDAEERLILR